MDSDFDALLNDLDDFNDDDINNLLGTTQDNDTSQNLQSLMNNNNQQDAISEDDEMDDLDTDALDEKLIPPDCLPKISNVVCSIDTQQEISLKMIAHRVNNTEYNPKRFTAAIMRIRNPKATANIFSNGRIVITGSSSEQTARLAARKFVKILQKAGVSGAEFHDFKIHNVVGHCNVGFPVKLEALSVKYETYCTYEPELFAGVIWKHRDPKICVIVFVSGELIFTGGKSRADVYRAFELLYPKLLQFIKKSHKERIMKKIREAQDVIAVGDDDSMREGSTMDTAIELD